MNILHLQDVEILKSGEAVNLLKEYSGYSPEQFSLAVSGKTKLPVATLATQIKCRQKAKEKLSGLPVEEMLFDTIPLEQSSSTITARFKVAEYSGIRAVDITGGLGIDTLFLADKFREVYHFEQSELLSKLASYNAGVAGKTNINFIQGDSIAMLENFPDKYFDLLYADPARRENERRSVDINFLKPDLLSNIELLKKKAKKLLVKLSPAFEINEAIRLFTGLSRATIISVKDECRELLLELSDNSSDDIIISGVELSRGSNPVIFTTKSNSVVSDIERVTDFNSGYLYESYCGMSKAGLDRSIAARYNLKAIADSEFYFHSEKLIKNFPGKVYEVNENIPYNLKNIKRILAEKRIYQANIKAKGSPVKPDDLTKKLKIKNGSINFIFVIPFEQGYKVIFAKSLN